MVELIGSLKKEHNSLDDFTIQIIITDLSIIASFFVALSVSVLNDNRQQKHLISNSLNSMILELGRIQNFLNGKTGPQTIFNKSTGKFKFDLITVETANFDSMLYSGVFHLLDGDTQGKITDFYERVKMINTMYIKLFEITWR